MNVNGEHGKKQTTLHVKVNIFDLGKYHMNDDFHEIVINTK